MYLNLSVSAEPTLVPLFLVCASESCRGSGRLIVWLLSVGPEASEFGQASGLRSTFPSSLVQRWGLSLYGSSISCVDISAPEAILCPNTDSWALCSFNFMFVFTFPFLELLPASCLSVGPSSLTWRTLLPSPHPPCSWPPQLCGARLGRQLGQVPQC